MKSLLVISLCLALSCAVSNAIGFFSGSHFQSLHFRGVDSNPCDPKKCLTPRCRCSGSDIPGNLKPSETPQMVVLTFQNGIRNEDMQGYNSLFSGQINPNGCPATGTFFVSHEYTDYFSVQTLRANRHEIGVNGVTAGHPQEWWKNVSVVDWINEMEGEKEILSLMANISYYDIIGERAPYLQMGGGNQMSSFKNSKLVYDASRVSVTFAHKPNMLWPYTYDYDSTQDCVSTPCPKNSAKGIWQVPLLAFYDQTGNPCSTLDACKANTSSQVFLLLHTAFKEHYLSNKAPLIITMGAGWLTDKQKVDGTVAFLNYLRGLKDVYLISADRMLQWIKKPTKVAELSTFKPWRCDQTPPFVCSESKASVCRYDKNRKLINESSAVQYRTTTCLKNCPKCYPWINDTQGKNCGSHRFTLT